MLIEQRSIAGTGSPFVPSDAAATDLLVFKHEYMG
jgi:hypothetical protein